MKKTCLSMFPALNAKWRSEAVATYVIYWNIPAIDDGSKCSQVFVGTNIIASDVHGMKSDKEFINSLEDNHR